MRLENTMLFSPKNSKYRVYYRPQQNGIQGISTKNNTLVFYTEGVKIIILLSNLLTQNEQPQSQTQKRCIPSH
ncbi:MAG: hypothetical protein IJD81_08840, partial [Oscillospiraceae bacterium]|nr:hypothetical protein [Oscillospiraceae bacterium]